MIAVLKRGRVMRGVSFRFKVVIPYKIGVRDRARGRFRVRVRAESAKKKRVSVKVGLWFKISLTPRAVKTPPKVYIKTTLWKLKLSRCLLGV